LSSLGSPREKIFGLIFDKENQAKLSPIFDGLFTIPVMPSLSDTSLKLINKPNGFCESFKYVKLFLNSCKGYRRLKAASILDHYLENVKKVVPQKNHFILVLQVY
jgi:hypothetical protein